MLIGGRFASDDPLHLAASSVIQTEFTSNQGKPGPRDGTKDPPVEALPPVFAHG